MDRFPLFRPSVSPQTADEMLHLLGSAAKEGKHVEIVDNSKLQTTDTEPSHFKRSLYKFFDIDEQPARLLYERMITELSQQLAGDKERASELVDSKVGNYKTIRLMVEGGKIEPLQSSWQTTRTFINASFDHGIYEKRSSVIAAVKSVLPRELAFSLEEGHIASLPRPFSRNAAEQILHDHRTLANDPVNATSGLSKQFEKDADRATFVFVDVDGSEQRFTQQASTIVIEALQNFSGGHPMLMRMLSQLMNQSATAQLTIQMNADCPTPKGDLHAGFESANALSRAGDCSPEYRIARIDDDTLHLTTRYFRRGHFMSNPPGLENEIPIAGTDGIRRPAPTITRNTLNATWRCV